LKCFIVKKLLTDLPGNRLTSSLGVVISGSGREDRLISSLLLKHFIGGNGGSEAG
jgi:hypothetical protein